MAMPTQLIDTEKTSKKCKQKQLAASALSHKYGKDGGLPAPNRNLRCLWIALGSFILDCQRTSSQGTPCLNLSKSMLILKYRVNQIKESN